VEAFQWTRQHRFEHGLDDLLDHVAASNVDVGP
jgi:hypothetical protein